MRYFDHDTAAGSDDKLLALRIEHGGEAVYVYWSLLEKIYADEAPVNLAETNAETKALTYRLGVGFDVLKTYVSYMVSIGLLDTVGNDPDTITSERAMRNIAAYNEKCETARQNGKKGGRKPKQKPNANQDGNRTLTASKPNAKLRKEKKGDKTYTVLSPTSDGAAAVGTAPPDVSESTRIINEVDAQYADWHDNAVPCPEGLNPFRSAS